LGRPDPSRFAEPDQRALLVAQADRKALGDVRLSARASWSLPATRAPDPADAGGRNPEGYGIYSPAEPPCAIAPRLYRYDERSWYYNPRGYCLSYGSRYWVPRVACATAIPTSITGWCWGGRRKQSAILFLDCRYISSLEPGDEPIPSVKTLSLLCELGAVGK
jgi:hypothetical protein